MPIGLILLSKFDYFLKRMDEREKLMQEYTVVYNKHAKEEEAVRKSTPSAIQDVLRFVIRERK